MWNKYKKRIEELEENNRALRDRLNNELEENRLMREERSSEPRPRVGVYLKNNKTITFLEADDFSFNSGDDLIQILKNNESIGLIRIEDVIAISNNPISVGYNEYFYTFDGRRI